MGSRHKKRGGFLGGKSVESRDYKNNDSGVWTMGDVAISNSEHPVGERVFTGVGTSTFIIPDGVEYISGVMIGGGGGGLYYNNSSSSYTYAMNGGGGGGLLYFNNLRVSDLEASNTNTNPRKINITVGAGGSQGVYASGSSSGLNSGISWSISTSPYSTAMYAGGGGPGRYSAQVYGGVTSISSLIISMLLDPTIPTGYRGNQGGDSQFTQSTGYGPSGGGGAAGYNSNGGKGWGFFAKGEDGIGGAGAGGGPSDNRDYDDHRSGGGGGAGLYGLLQKQYNASIVNATMLNRYHGGGAGGIYGQNGGVPSKTGSDISGGLYGGGGGGSSSVYFGPGGDGAQGAVRLIWGDSRSFPYNAAATNNDNIHYSVAGNY
jgi:hypothetical protein